MKTENDSLLKEAIANIENLLYVYERHASDDPEEHLYARQAKCFVESLKSNKEVISKVKIMKANTKADNELIAEFIGAERLQAFEESWDSLMSVVEQCKDRQKGKSLDISRSMYTKITAPLADVDIDGTFEAVVDFIKWYNSQK